MTKTANNEKYVASFCTHINIDNFCVENLNKTSQIQPVF